MALSDWSIVTRSVRARLFSSVTTIVTVGIAVALMTLLLSMKASGREAFSRGTGNAQMVVSRDPGALTSVLNNLFYADAPGTPIPWGDYEDLASRYPFAWAEPTALGDSYQGHHVMGVRRSFFVNFRPVSGEPFALASGRVFADDFELVLGAEAARATGLGIGDEISIEHGTPRQEGTHAHDTYSYGIVGVLEPTGSAHDRAIFSSLGSAWILHAHDRIKDERGADAPRTTRADLIPTDRKITGVIASLGPRRAALNQVLQAIRTDPDWTVAQPADTVRRLFEIVGSVDQLLIAMGVAVLLSSGVSIMVALYNSMEQRRRQIAVLRVLGASRRRVFALVLSESALIGLVGGALGVVLGIVSGEVVRGILMARLGLAVQPSLPIDGYLMMVLATVALSAIAGIAPAVVAYRTSVVRALRPIG